MAVAGSVGCSQVTVHDTVGLVASTQLDGLLEEAPTCIIIVSATVAPGICSAAPLPHHGLLQYLLAAYSLKHTV